MIAVGEKTRKKRAIGQDGPEEEDLRRGGHGRAQVEVLVSGYLSKVKQPGFRDRFYVDGYG